MRKFHIRTNSFISLPCVIIVLAFILSAIPAAAQVGIWTSAGELAALPQSGPAWTRLVDIADTNVFSDPKFKNNLADQDDKTGKYALAKAIVYARTGNASYKADVIAIIDSLVSKGKPFYHDPTDNDADSSNEFSRTLAWGRNIAGYVMAADLIDYRDNTFEVYVDSVAMYWQGTQLESTLEEMAASKMNNWGNHADASLAAIYLYRGQMAKFEAHWQAWKDKITGDLLDQGRNWGKNSTSWYLDQNHFMLINPKYAVKQGPAASGDPLLVGPLSGGLGDLDIDGLLPDEMRRDGGGILRGKPVYTKYAWEGLQGLLTAARILHARASRPGK